ncbi:MAG: OsmC family protein [Silanimonas sp.]
MATLPRTATAFWEGPLKTGRGGMSTPQSGVFAEQRFGFGTRFGDEKGTNPEELIAAAHAGCFSMALGFMLETAGFPATRIDTEAKLALSVGEASGPVITGIALTVRGVVPGVDSAKFLEFANNAKANCVVSKALSVPITLDAALA